MTIPLLPPSSELHVCIAAIGFAVFHVSEALMRKAGREAVVANVDHHTSVQCITEKYDWLLVLFGACCVVF
jgi:hypothetical protein